jgi:hypothetical protein
VRANLRTFHYAEFILCLTSFMPPSQAALRTALVTAMAFAHHKAQEKTAPKAMAAQPGRRYQFKMRQFNNAPIQS